MDLNTWLHWIIPSPGYFLLAFVGLLVLFGLIGGLTETRNLDETDTPPPEDKEPNPGKSCWNRNEEHYREWNAYQVREQHRTTKTHTELN